LGAAALLVAIGLSGGASSVPRAQALPTQQEGEEAGKLVFDQHCAICHGLAASGRLGPPLNQLPPELVGVPAEALAQGLTELLRGGIPGKMPMFTAELLNDEQILSLTRYLISLDNSLPTPHLYEALAPVTAENAPAGNVFFPETGHSVGPSFAAYWQANGGLARFGYPLSEQYNGIGSDGQPYTMQLFERARFELHPENPDGQQVLLGLLGAEELGLRTHFLGGGESVEGGP
jgi:mono/diheme cytochrome c family protein